MDLQTGDIGFVHGKTFLDRGIEFFERFLPEAFHHESKAFLPSHCLTIFMEGKDIFCGESVWPRYKIDDFLLDYMGKNEMKMVIKRPIVPFTDAEKEVGKQYMLKLSSYGMYAFWRYPAYIWYA